MEKSIALNANYLRIIVTYTIAFPGQRYFLKFIANYSSDTWPRVW